MSEKSFVVCRKCNGHPEQFHDSWSVNDGPWEYGCGLCHNEGGFWTNPQPWTEEEAERFHEQRIAYKDYLRESTIGYAQIDSDHSYGFTKWKEL